MGLIYLCPLGQNFFFVVIISLDKQLRRNTLLTEPRYWFDKTNDDLLHNTINILLWCRKCSEAFPVWTEALSITQFATLPFDVKRLFTNMRFRCNFCSNRSVQTWLGPSQKPIPYRMFHFEQWSGAVLFQSRNCFESSVPSVNGSSIQYTSCDTLTHYVVQCEHSLTHRTLTSNSPLTSCRKKLGPK